MHKYSSQADLLVEDMSAIICKDHACMVNYCGLLKKSYPSDWEHSSDCMDEYTGFQDCMKQEQRRWSWQKPNSTKYDWIQQRLAERKLANKFNLLSDLEDPIRNKIMNEGMEEMKQ